MKLVNSSGNPESEQMFADYYPLSIIMSREMLSQGRWCLPKWEVVGVVVGNPDGQDREEKVLIHAEQGREHYLWRGFNLNLYRDSAESYWYNLVARFPSLFVICHAEEEGEMAPFSVTANYDEASAHQEADDPVFSIPLPADIYPWLERFVVENYQPQEKKKRKRTRWKEETAYGRRPITGQY